MRLDWPLIGRLQELQLVETALSDSGTSGVVVCGTAGVGKSRIARAALALGADRGWVSHWVAATSSARDLPLGALAFWVAPEAGDRVHVVRALVEALTSAPPGQRAVIGIDDVPLLDDLSTFVVHQIVERTAAKLVLTIRDGTPILGPTRDLLQAGRFERLDLQPLSREETTSLISAALGGTLESDAARRIWELTRGNVLYVRNIVEHEVAAGRLAERSGCWRFVADPVVPTDLAQLIDMRIGALPAAISDVVDVLAVGEPLALASLQRITDPAAVEEAEVRGLIMIESVGHGLEARVAHPLYGEVRRRRTAQTRLRRLRGLVARELGAADDGSDARLVVRRATLTLDSDLTPDPSLFVSAAQRATWLAELGLAESLADAAIHSGAGSEAYFVRAHALSWLTRGDEAERLLADLATMQLTEPDRARLAYLQANNMLFACANPARAKDLIDAAASTTVAAARDCIDAFLAAYWTIVDNPPEARRAAARVSIDRLPAVAGSSTGWIMAMLAGEAGRPSDSCAAAEAGYAAAARCFDTPHTRFNIADAYLGALLLAGNLIQAVHVAEDARSQAADLPGIAAPLAKGLTGRAALGIGDLLAASTALSQAVDGLCAAGLQLGWGFRYQVCHGLALAQRGLVAEAGAALAAADEWYRPWRPSNTDRRLWDREHGLARAWVAANEGAVSAAIEIFVSLAETARANGQFGIEVLCLQTATQFGERSCAARLRELGTVVDGPRVAIAGRFAAALFARDGAELAAVSTEFEQMGDRVAAIDAVSHAAISYRSQGLRGSSLGCSARAQALAEQCGGATTPALRQAAEPLPLTDREREIVALLVQGLTSRAIGERLTLSTRTVEGHIYRAMAKTGTTSRDELATLLRRRNSS